jgi:hypothetical protein
MSVDESIIRDKLSNNLELIEEGLTLLKVEQYLPNEIGSRGFIDIFAKDKNGKFVLIELKKSDAASRQAAHEVLKYIEGIKVNYALKDNEIRVFVISTHWKELIVPFSSLAQRINFSLTGLNLKVNEDGSPLEISNVDLLPLATERLFTPWHEVSRYKSLKNLEKGISSFQEVCSKKNIENYVLIILEISEEIAAQHQQQSYEASKVIFSQMGVNPLSAVEYAKKNQVMRFMIYFAMLQIDDDLLTEKIKQKLDNKKEEYQEFIDELNEMEDDWDKTNIIHNKLLELKPWPFRDHLEISYPAKFTKIIDEDGWEICETKRFGKLARNILLENDTIISEIRGEQGITRQRYIKQLNHHDPVEISIVKTEINECLEDNPTWAQNFAVLIPEISKMASAAPTQISILNPSNIILSIYLLIARQDGMLYLPYYKIYSEPEGKKELIYGEVIPTGAKPSMKKIISDYYNNSWFDLLAPLNWGGYQRKDASIVRDIGLSYATYKVIVDSNKRSFFKLENYGWEPCESRRFHQGIDAFIGENPDFIHDICGFFSKYWNGTSVVIDRDDSFDFQT